MEVIKEIEEQSKDEFMVVVNHEEQYSIWPTFKEVPLGWKGVGVSGSEEHCLAYINEVWTDITPLSVRLAKQEHLLN